MRRAGLPDGGANGRDVPMRLTVPPQWGGVTDPRCTPIGQGPLAAMTMLLILLIADDLGERASLRRK